MSIFFICRLIPQSKQSKKYLRTNKTDWKTEEMSFLFHISGSEPNPLECRRGRHEMKENPFWASDQIKSIKDWSNWLQKRYPFHFFSSFRPFSLASILIPFIQLFYPFDPKSRKFFCLIEKREEGSLNRKFRTFVRFQPEPRLGRKHRPTDSFSQSDVDVNSG